MGDNNVLYVTVDSLRADHVGHLGYDRDTTPFLDELAKRGSTFRETYAPAGGTRYAFPSLLTGVYPMMYGGFRQVTTDQTVISEVFRDSGYKTGGFHSNLYLSENFGYDRGWDEFYDSKSETSTSRNIRAAVKNLVHETPLYYYAQKLYNIMEAKSGINVGSYLVPADKKTDMALEFVERVEGESNVFLWVHYMDPHHPFLPPEKYQQLFRDEPVSRRDSVKLRQKLLNDPEGITDEELQQQIDLYDAETRFWDENLRRLVEETEERLDDLTVAVTSDHGEHFLEHGYFSGAKHKTIKQHVPLVFAGDGWDDDGEYEDLVAFVDIPATLVDHAGIEQPENWYGLSLRKLITEGEWPRSETIGGSRKDQFSCRTHEWNYIWHGEDEPIELFDLSADPDEQNNVADEHPDRVDKFQAKIDDHRKRVRATDADVDVELEEEVEERLQRLGYKV